MCLGGLGGLGVKGYPSVMAIYGVDVSQFVTKVDWPTLAKQGIRFASVRCTYGMTLDPMHDAHTRGARAAGLVTQSYCFDERSIPLVPEVSFFLSHAYLDQLSPCGDFEQLLPDKSVPPDAGSRADQWAELVKRYTGNPSPILYSSKYYWQEMVKQLPSVGGYDGWPWWCADYVGSPIQIVVPGLPYIALQYAGDVAMEGVMGLIDRDVVFASTLSDLCVPGFVAG